MNNLWMPSGVRENWTNRGCGSLQGPKVAQLGWTGGTHHGLQGRGVA